MTHTQERVTTAVRMLMAAQRLKQSDLALALGITQPSVSAKMAGRARWSVDDLDKLAQRFDVALVDLLSPPQVYVGMGAPIGTGRNRRRSSQRIRGSVGGSVLTLPLPRTSFEQIAA